MSNIVNLQPPPIHDKMLTADGFCVVNWWKWFSVLGRWARQLTGTHAERLKLDAKAVPEGSTWYETDRGVSYRTYLDAGVLKWFWESGAMPGTLDPDTKPTGLGTDDEGFLFRATDFEHTYEWSGTAWRYAPGDPGSGFVQWGTDAPTAGVWQLADGSVTTRSLPDGTVVDPYTAPDLIGNYAKGAAAYTGTPSAGASSLAITGNTGDENAHTHDIDHDHPAFGNTPVGTTAGAVPAASPTINVPNYTGSSGPGSAHHHDKGTLAITGSIDVPNLELIPYFRR